MENKNIRNMEDNDKNFDIKNIIIIILVLLVLFFLGYLVYDKISLDNENNNSVVNNDDKINQDMDSNTDDETDGENEDNDCKCNQVINNDSSVYDKVKLDDYKNYDGSYGNVETLIFNDPTDEKKYYYIELKLDGTTSYYENNDGKVLNEKGLLSGIIDIVSFADGAGNVYVENCYMLDKNGNVYRYKLSDLIEENVKVEKLNVSNVEKLIHIDWVSRENAGGNWALLAIKSDGNYVELARAGV